MRSKRPRRASARARCSSSDLATKSLEARIEKAEQALQRYFDAFEAGSPTAGRLSGRMDELEHRLADLRMRRAIGERDQSLIQERNLPDISTSGATGSRYIRSGGR